MEAQHHLWQQAMDSVLERDKYVLLQSLWTDCDFLVGPDEATARQFECHRLMLAKTSPVFAAMLYGKLFRLGEIIRVIDVTPRAFEKLLQYAYEGRVTLEDFDVACELLYAAKKYLMPGSLLRQIRGFLWASLYPNNVWRGLLFADANDEPEILDTAWQIIQFETTAMLNHQDFFTIPVATLSMLLQQDALDCSETVLFLSVIRWAKKQQNLASLQQAQLENPPTLRETLEPVVGHIRFLAMTPAEIARGPVKFKILTVEEENALLVAVSAPELADVPEYFCQNASKRAAPYNPTFMVLGQPKENLLNYEGYEDTCTLFASLSYITRDSSTLGVRVPTQVKPEGSDENTYKEDLTLLLYDKANKKLLSKTNFCADVPFNDVIDVPYEETVATEQAGISLVLKIIFHASGRYPASDFNIKDDVIAITGPFDCFPKVILCKCYSKFIQYHAFLLE